jgi:hypothetical protein
MSMSIAETNGKVIRNLYKKFREEFKEFPEQVTRKLFHNTIDEVLDKKLE